MAENLGFDQVWTNGFAISRDQFLVLCHIASITSRIGLWTAIVDPFSRHPVSLAASAGALSALTKRKIRLGIGSSKPCVFGQMGIDSNFPAQTSCEAAEIARKLLTGEKVT